MGCAGARRLGLDFQQARHWPAQQAGPAAQWVCPLCRRGQSCPPAVVAGVGALACVLTGGGSLVAEALRPGLARTPSCGQL